MHDVDNWKKQPDTDQINAVFCTVVTLLKKNYNTSGKFKLQLKNC